MMETEIDAKLVCRLCHKNGGNMYSIFQKNTSGLQIINLIKDCLPLIIIYRTDPLSKIICEVCNQNLNIVHNFKNTTLDILNKQKNDLLLKLDDSGVRLYLGTLDSQKGEDEYANLLTHKKTADISTLTDHSYSIHDNIELIKADDQLQFDTNNSDLASEVNSFLEKSLNGFIDETGTESDIDLGDAAYISTNMLVPKTKKRKRIKHNSGAIFKKRRIIGPKSRMEPNPRVKIHKVINYSPNSLLKYAVDALNKQNVDGYTADTCYKFEREIEEMIHSCNYCGVVFETESELALHEMNSHIKLNIEPVDVLEYWNKDEPNSEVRNAWLEDNYEIPSDVEMEADAIESELEENDLLMPLVEVATEDDIEENIDITSTFKDNVIYIDGEATVDGVRLSDLPKDAKRDLFQSVKFNGLKRKFCSLCRYTFKDNWAIEGHYQTKSCLYTCHYCGLKCNKQRQNFDSHIQAHILNGDTLSDRIFVTKNKHNPVPKGLPPTALKAYYPNRDRSNNRYMKHVAIRPKRMSSLMLKRRAGSLRNAIKMELQDEIASSAAISTTKLENQAYCCRKCFEVFSKLDEYNVHITECTGVQNSTDPALRVVRTYKRRDPDLFKPTVFYKTSHKTENHNTDEKNQFSPTGRPIRHCVKEVLTYDDEAIIEKAPDSPQQQGRYECGLCSSVFPTMHSRNSHMRIHKVGFKMAGTSSKNQNILRNNDTTITRKYSIQNEQNDSHYNTYVKQETMEPIVEIHEGPSKIPSSIGSVSITPVLKHNRSSTVSPAIMQLVQNNPNITIKSRHEGRNSSSGSRGSDSPAPPPPSPPLDPDKCYRCSSCSKPFANKSNLYFHKKNQCVGSKYPCPFCKKRFGTEAAYSSHIFYSHPV